MLPQKNVGQEDPENPWKCLRKFPSRKDLKYFHHTQCIWSILVNNYRMALEFQTKDIVKPT